jgi:hypothetical protein
MGGETKKYDIVVPGGVSTPREIELPRGTELMVKNLLILGVGDTEYTETRDVSYTPSPGDPNFGVYLLAARRQSDGLWVALRIITQRGRMDTLLRGKPRSQILGLKLASGEALYVGHPPDACDNRPRVYWGESAGNPYDAVNHKELQWQDGEPLYPACEAGEEFIVQGTREAEHFGEIEPPILFAGGQPIYRARPAPSKLWFLVWGKWKSKPGNYVSPPKLEGKEIVAWATDGGKIRRISIPASRV